MRPHEIAGMLFRCDDEDRQWMPDIPVRGLKGDELVQVFEALQAAADPWSDRDTVWHAERAVDLPVATLPNAAELMVAGDTTGFHVLIKGLMHAGVRLPNLGAFVARNGEHQFAISFHYSFFIERPWDDDAVYAWNEAEIDALFDLLAEIRAAAPAAQISVDKVFSEEDQQRFALALDAATAKRGATLDLP
jgi:hypothetical protein